MKNHAPYIIRHLSDKTPACCSKCGQQKEISEFYIHSKRLDGAIRYRPHCKECKRKGPRLEWSRPVHEEIIKTGIQTCKKCKEEKPVSDFYANGCFADGIQKYRSTCKPCVLANSRKNHPRWYKTKAEKRSSSAKVFISGILNHASKRKQHLGFNIDREYLFDLYEKQSGKCAISGVNMTFAAGNGRVFTNISIDRIDSTKGYVRGNVQLVCDVVNIMKQDLPQDDFLDWCRLIIGVADEKV